LNSIIAVKGITRRFFFNVMGFIAALVIFAVIVSGIFIRDFYYAAVRQSLNSQMSMSAGFIQKNSAVSYSEFLNSARDYIAGFTEKNMICLEFFDSQGNMAVSSKGLIVKDVSFPDYEGARDSKDGRFIYTGEIGDEKIMALTRIMPSNNGESVGAVRYSISLTLIDRQVVQNIFTVSIIGFLFLLLVFICGFYFLRSIIKPIRAITASALKIANGNFEVRLEVKDTDEVGQLCDTINYMAAELASTDKMKNDFISLVSHELRTPLTVIKGWSETINGIFADSKKIDVKLAAKGVSVIESETERLSGLVEDLLDYSKLKAGHLSLKMEKVDILAEIGEAVFVYADIAKKTKNIDISYNEPVMLPVIWADPKRLRQVFFNILDNAVKYSNENSTVIVDATEHDVFVMVTISDMGCGIAAEDLDRVKDRFYKSNMTVTGSGIGLAIVDEIIKQHDGVLEIDSKEGVGTTVSIALPIYVEELDVSV